MAVVGGGGHAEFDTKIPKFNNIQVKLSRSFSLFSCVLLMKCENKKHFPSQRQLVAVKLNFKFSLRILNSIIKIYYSYCRSNP
jgi:hypothetical protein